MRFLKRLFFMALAVILLAAALAYLLPREVRVSRSITIDAPREEVFPLVNALREARKWSPWLGRDPEVRLAYSGPESGTGSRLDWRSHHPQVGSGTQVIAASDPPRHVAMDLDFGDMGPAWATFDLEPAGTGTLITLNFTTDLGLNPAARWMGLMMDRRIGTDFEHGLANLKRLAEGV